MERPLSRGPTIEIRTRRAIFSQTCIIEYSEDLGESQLNNDEKARDVANELTSESRKYYIATVHMYINEQCSY